MKKVRLITLVTLIITLTALVLTGCYAENDISAVSIKDYDPDSVIEVAVGGFDFNAYTLLVTHTSGSIEEIALSEDMIAPTERVKLYQVGDHEITVSYGGYSCIIKVSVKRSAFEALHFPEESVFTYDGNPHTVEVSGNIPANAVISYPGGNSFINAGTYDVTAIVHCDGYVTQKLTTTVKIERAKYDMSGVEFADKVVVYDGRPHTIEVAGTLPAGVSAPTYTVNGNKAQGVIEAGEYEVVASFSSANPNYEAVSSMKAKLKIVPAVYNLNGVDIAFKNEDGSEIAGSEKTYDHLSVSYAINDPMLLESNVQVSFSVFDGQGKPLNDSNGNPVTSFKNAGSYTVKADFSISDNKNYAPVEPITRTFVINKAEYDLSVIHFDSNYAIYDGELYNLSVVLPVDHDVKPDDVRYEYYLNGALLSVNGNAGVSKAGVYTVKAIFNVRNANYKPIEDMSATLEIRKQEIDVSWVGFYGDTLLEYSGAPYVPSFTTWQESLETDYDLLAYSQYEYYALNSNGQYDKINGAPADVGAYECRMTVTVADDYAENYVFEKEATEINYSFKFEIYKKEIKAPTVTFNDEIALTYNGQGQEPEVEIVSDSALMTVKKYYRFNNEQLSDGVLPINAGVYECVISVTVNDSKNYSFANGEVELEFPAYEFRINRQKIDISNLSVNADEFVYNGSDQHPVLNENEILEFVTYSSVLYDSDGKYRMDETVNRGTYIYEVTFTSISDNYQLYPSNKREFEFEISPVKIDVSSLEWDVLSFEYNGTKQHPNLKNIPEHVTATTYLHWSGDENDNLAEKDGKYLAIDRGVYGCIVSLAPESINYELVGEPTVYKTEFTITGIKVDITEIVNTTFKLLYKESGYADSDLVSLVVGELDYAVVGSVSGRHQIFRGLNEGGEEVWEEYSTYMENKVPEVGQYKVQFRFESKHNYVLVIDGKEFLGCTADIYYEVVVSLT